MKRLEQLTIDQVISEWLKAEWYKSSFDNFRKDHNEIILDPDLSSEEENEIRKRILETVRHDVITPLYNLSVQWYSCTFSSIEEYKSTFIIPSGHWYRVSGKTFQAGKVPEYLFHDVGHKEDIRKKVLFLETNSGFNERMILVGSSENTLTVIEGNHRMVASIIHMQKHNLSHFPQKVIIGFSDIISRYRWSIEWEHMHDLLSLCEKEEESFIYQP